MDQIGRLISPSVSPTAAQRLRFGSDQNLRPRRRPRNPPTADRNRSRLLADGLIAGGQHGQQVQHLRVPRLAAKPKTPRETKAETKGPPEEPPRETRPKPTEKPEVSQRESRPKSFPGKANLPKGKPAKKTKQKANLRCRVDFAGTKIGVDCVG